MKPARYYRARAVDALRYNITAWIAAGLFAAAFVYTACLEHPGIWPLLFACLGLTSILIAFSEGHAAGLYTSLADQEDAYQAAEDGITIKVYLGTPGAEELHAARFPRGVHRNPFPFQGHTWHYKYSGSDASGSYDLLWRPLEGKEAA